MKMNIVEVVGLSYYPYWLNKKENTYDMLIALSGLTFGVLLFWAILGAANPITAVQKKDSNNN